MSEKAKTTFCIEIATEYYYFTLDEIWPDGDAPENPTAEDVMRGRCPDRVPEVRRNRWEGWGVIEVSEEQYHTLSGTENAAPAGKIPCSSKTPRHCANSPGHGHRERGFDDTSRVHPMSRGRQPRRREARGESPYYTTRSKDEFYTPGNTQFVSVGQTAQEALDYWKAKAEREFVYFVTQSWDDYQCPDPSPVKIGFASDPIARVADLQTANPHELCISAIISGGRHMERRLHGKWRPYRLRGEWFAKEMEMPILHMAWAMAEIQIKAHKAGESLESARFASEDAFIDNRAAGADAERKGYAA